ncbi:MULTISPECIES: hypothetical protein [Butyricimonas]|uniref:hypothetical protein n=1 Tax=Butyricimonas TaxID=574697 RepID=UPI0007FB3BD3|nr:MULTISPECIES: hypothetical protein [Butyricimonas]
MSDNGLDLIIYIALTLGASALGLIKSAKEKKAKGTHPEVHQPEEFFDESEDDTVIITQQPEIFKPEEIFQPVWHNEELSEKMEKEKEESITGFGRTDEERYAMLEKMQQESRKSRVKRASILLEEAEQELSNKQQNNTTDNHFEFDIRQAIIASEILNRKY